MEEYVYVLSGRLTARLGEDDHMLEAGDALYFQARLPHGFTAGDAPCRYLLIIDNRP